MRRNASGEDPALTYRHLRAIIGWVALAMPVTLLITGVIDGHVQTSISDYYYTRVGSVFTGIMSVIGFFLVAYRIRAWALDGILTTLAGIAAFGVAFFHSTPPRGIVYPAILSDVHLWSAGVLFVLLGAISVLIFPYADDPPDARWRLVSYRVLGGLIWLALILMPVLNAVAEPYYNNDYGFFILEAVCVIAFSVSFIIKGHARTRVPVPEEERTPSPSA